MQVHIRPATLGDAPAMLRVTQQAHRTSYDALIPVEHQAAFRARYGNEPAGRQQLMTKLMRIFERAEWQALVAEVDDEIVGYTVIAHGNPAQLHGLFVEPQYQGKGIGAQLFAASLRGLDSVPIDLLVVTGNDRAIRLYEKHGFRAIGHADVLYFGAQQLRMRRPPLPESKH